MLLTDIFAAKAAFESGCLVLCMWVGLSLGAVALLCATGAARDLVNRWTRLGRFDKFFIVCCVAFITLTGATKGDFWNRVRSDGADTISGTSLIGVYKGLSNDVQTVEGVVTTNYIPMIRVVWTGSGITTATPVQYRYADTNNWAAAVKSNLTSGSEGTTNWMEFVTTEAVYDMPNWWVGNDTPPTVITSSGIKITVFSANGNGVIIRWMCDDPRATTFRVWRKKARESDWTDCGEDFTGGQAAVPGFFLDAEWIWRVTSDFLEDGE